MRGEKAFLVTRRLMGVGSPPHARGKVVHGNCINYMIRITPACAGKSNTPSV